LLQTASSTKKHFVLFSSSLFLSLEFSARLGLSSRRWAKVFFLVWFGLASRVRLVHFKNPAEYIERSLEEELESPENPDAQQHGQQLRSGSALGRLLRDTKSITRREIDGREAVRLERNLITATTNTLENKQAPQKQ
jgi:hypothetical protein